MFFVMCGNHANQVSFSPWILLLPVRLCYFYSTMPKVRICENVTTGEIGKITENVLGEEYDMRFVETRPSET